MDLLGYLINDLRQILRQNEVDKLADSAHGGMSITACSHKITHIEDVIRKLPDELRLQFISGGYSQELKQLIEQFRNQKNSMIDDNYKRKFITLPLIVQENDLGMFDQSKHENYTTLGSNSKSNNNSSQKAHYRQTNGFNSLDQNSARYVDMNSNNQMKRNLSASKKDNYKVYDNYDNQRCYTQGAENNEENISKPYVPNIV